MEIIKRGKLPEEEMYSATCQNCQSVIRFKRKEAKLEFDVRIESSLLRITCPVCQRSIYKRQ